MIPAPAARWRGDAETLRRRGADGHARLLESCADELDAWLLAREDETLALEDAAAETGYSVAHFRRLVKAGTLRDVADEGPTRVRRGDLPRKPGGGPRLYTGLRTA